MSMRGRMTKDISRFTGDDHSQGQRGQQDGRWYLGAPRDGSPLDRMRAPSMAFLPSFETEASSPIRGRATATPWPEVRPLCGLLRMSVRVGIGR